MGFLDKIVSVAVPAAIGFATGGPAGAFAGAVSGSQAEKAQRKQKQLIEISIAYMDLQVTAAEGGGSGVC